MKFSLMLTALFISCLANAVEITNFGSSTFTIDGENSSFTAIQTTTDLQISGTDSNNLVGIYDSVDLSSVWGMPLDISASAVNAISSTQFTITLFDGEFNQAKFIGGEWNSLLDGTSLTFSNFDGSGTFDTTNVIGLDLSGDGFIDPINVTLNNLSMVPEPSTYAFFTGILVLSYSVVARRFHIKV